MDDKRKDRDKSSGGITHTLEYVIIIILLIGILGNSGGSKSDAQKDYQKYKAYIDDNSFEMDYDKLKEYSDSHDSIQPDDTNTIEGTPDPNNQVFYNDDIIHDKGFLDKQVELAKENDSAETTNWTITVDTENYRMTILRKAPDATWKPLGAFYCGVGDATRKGVFKVSRRYAEYGGELFTTVYYDNGEKVQTINNLYLGYPGKYTDGDIVLEESNAHFVYDAIPSNTVVVIY